MSLHVVRCLRSILVIALLVGLSSPAHARRRDSDAKKRAQEHYAAGVRAYNVGEFDQAIVEWKTGYKLHGSAFFLFNIAQAYRGTRDYSKAIFFFNAYLREKPDASNAEEVTTLRDEMERLLKEEESNKQMRPKEPIAPDTVDIKEESGNSKQATVPVAATTTDSEQTESGKSSLKTVGLVTGGTGLALLATGIGFAAAAASAQSELEQASRDLEPWNKRLQDLEASGSRNASLATVFTILGAAAVVGGVGVYYFGMKKDQETERSRAKVSIIPTVGPTQAGAMLRVDF